VSAGVPGPTATLLGLRFRRDRVQLVIWVLSLSLLVVFTAVALAAEFPTQSDREDVLRLATATPTLLAVRGMADGAGAGAFVVFEDFAFIAVLAGLMSTSLAVRHIRADEEAGRAELIAATTAGRLAPTIATLVEGVIANLLVALGIFLGLLASGFDGAGAATFGWAVGATGIAFLGVGLLCAQVFSTSRGANGCAAALVGVAYVVRAIGDVSGTVSADRLATTSGWVSWLSPIGWAQHSRPFGENAWWSALLAVALCAVLMVLTLALQTVRDNGAGLINARSGRARASVVLRGPLGLAWRLTRGSIIGWAVGALVLAMLAGALGGSVLDAFQGQSPVRSAVTSMTPGGTGSIIQIFVTAMMGFVGLTVAGCMLQMVMRLRQDEAAGTTEVVLATRVGRVRWFLCLLVIGVLAATVILLVSGVVTGALLAQGTGGTTGVFSGTVGAALAQLPAVLIYLTVLGLVFALAPRVTIGVGWAMLAVGAFLGQFGGLLSLPHWLRNIAPSQHTPAVPMPNADFSGAWWMLGIATVVAAVGAVLLRRRDTVVG
jgi:ABC-2 type transport system permease protein